MEKDFENLRKALDRLAYLLHKDEIQAFEEFLEYAIAQHSLTIKKDMQNTSKEVRQAYFDVYSEWIKLQYLKIHTRDCKWFDAFGLYFEIHSSKWSKQKKGQFFTPIPVCDFMVKVQVTEEMKEERVIDPTCGSGRFLIASHAYNPKNFHYGEDIDRTCCMMSVLNMMIHGVQGEVAWRDSLDPNSWFGGWMINPCIKEYKGIPNIELLEKENSFIFHVAQKNYQERLEEIQKEEQEEKDKLYNSNFLEINEDDKLDFDNSDNNTSFDFF